MEPLPATRAVRRTVRTAVALGVGQVLLVALIGWVMFAFSHGRAAVGQVAAPPVGVHPAPDVPASRGTGTAAAPSSLAPAAHTTTRVPVRRPTTTPTTVVPAEPPSSRPAVTTTPSAQFGLGPNVTPPTSAPVTTDPAPPSTAASTAPPAPKNPSPSATPTDVVPVIGDRCFDPYAWDRTADDVLVRCLPAPGPGFRWKIA